MHPVVIVGGGISGLSAAYYLAKAGVHSKLAERCRLGGVIQTETVQGCVVEGGPDSFLAAKPWAMDLIRDLGMAGDVIASNDHQRVTYMRRGGRLIRLPEGLIMMAPTRVGPILRTRLLGWGTKMRMGLEWFRGPGSPALDRSIADFIEDHYGQEAVDYLAEPLLAGVYGGDPRELSAASVLPRFVEWERRYGSLTRGALAARQVAGGGPIFRSLRAGMGSLVEALRTAIASHARIERLSIERIERSDHGFRLKANGAWLETDRVILACPAHEASVLAAGVDAELASLLQQIPYNSSMIVALGYNKATFGRRLDGFGFLVPARERRRLVACTWVGVKFAHRIPDDRVLLRCFLGGAGDSAALDQSDEAAVASVRDELRDIMGVTAEPLFARVWRWPRSMAQYTVGHAARMERIEARLKAVPGLYLAGNAYYGIGIPDCVRIGKEAAERIAVEAAK